MEDPEVFAATHAKLLQLLRDGVIDGLRIDHPDGLADPEGYLRRLDEAIRGEAQAPGDRTPTPGGGTVREGGDVRESAGIRQGAADGRWTVVEKILGRDERLPRGWRVAGTTGYDALHHVDGLFLDPAGWDRLTAIYRDIVAPAADAGGDWPATVRRAAHEVLAHDLAAEVGRLVRCATRLCDTAPRARDHAPWALRTAITELLVRLPVYRPYVSPGAPVPAADAAMLSEAAHGARTAFTVAQEARAVDTVRDAALGRLGDGPHHREFCARFAQTAAALRAKSVEDSAFYRYTPLLSAAEVGGDPGRPAVTADEFHAFCARVQRDWPLTGTVLSTHDTKRSADVRARLAVLTEWPRRWGRLVRALLADAADVADGGVPAPDPHVAWTAWQTALGLGLPEHSAGSAPRPAAADADRLVPAVLKAVREAGLRTSWTEQDTAYEEAVAAFAEAGPCAARAAASGVPAASSTSAPTNTSTVSATSAPAATSAASAPADMSAASATSAPAATSAAPAASAASAPVPVAPVPAAFEGFAAFDHELAAPARANTLGAALLHLTMPGVPDLYMGTELPYLALVDPDNRRPPRFRPELLAELDAGHTGYAEPDGLPAEKLLVTAAALRLRRRHPAWFGASGSYAPIAAEGRAAAHCVAFARSEEAVTAVTRLSVRLAETGGWRGTVLPLPPGRWRDLLTGRTAEGRCPLDTLFSRLPVALLVRG
ncbi:malto-oligosyltrehalose synthase [Streptomyces sp. XD-27]|uniref:malto-oligosyltrehalose synthase n=1 Tax=Streptomyces sp. XD-27 TaxID=3062779 RepID=UPI0026F4310B|nr:malto-oligosyltrehalose synthase [Streptomyces sp. XD-27]WKX73106.1 malto-oligosyltrehalose synthase [Streptomyces sp. XD-27]